MPDRMTNILTSVTEDGSSVTADGGVTVDGSSVTADGGVTVDGSSVTADESVKVDGGLTSSLFACARRE